MNFTVRPFRPGEENYAADAQRCIYSEEYRWGPAFTRYASKIALDFASREKTPGEELWVAEAEGKLIGCIMLCQSGEPLTGQLRLFLVEKAYRRSGVGKALTQTLLQKAQEARYRRIILWTAAPLTSAIRHYEKLGFRKVEETENHDWSLDGETVTEVKMLLDLASPG